MVPVSCATLSSQVLSYFLQFCASLDENVASHVSRLSVLRWTEEAGASIIELDIRGCMLDLVATVSHMLL